MMLSSLCQRLYHRGNARLQYRFKNNFCLTYRSAKTVSECYFYAQSVLVCNLYGENKGYSMTRYQHLANLLAERINKGCIAAVNATFCAYPEPGTCVSISTIQQAYQILENLQLITPQPRSGYFVSPRKAQPPVPAMTRPVQRPVM
jgi:hypothetical protein